MELVEFLQKKKVPVELSTELIQGCRKERLPKNYCLLLPGSHSKKIFFFEDGLARTFYYKNDRDITHGFYKENDSYTPIETILYNRPSNYGLQLLEPSIVCKIDYAKIAKYANRSIEINKLIQTEAFEMLLSLYDRMDSIQFQSARERYNNMLENYPDILLRAPLRHIASYLGITPQTLSVIRSKRFKQETAKAGDK